MDLTETQISDAAAMLIEALGSTAEIDDLTQEQAATRVVTLLANRGWAITKLMDGLDAEPYEEAWGKVQEAAAYTSWGVSLSVLRSIVETFVANADLAYANAYAHDVDPAEEETIEPVQ